MKHRPLKNIRLEVNGDDIDEMYERYDSGMADHTTANAVCLALRRLLRPGLNLKVNSTSHEHLCRLSVKGELFPLPTDVFWWLDNASRGCSVSPTSFSIAIPEELLEIEMTATDSSKNAIAA